MPSSSSSILPAQFRDAVEDRSIRQRLGNMFLMNERQEGVAQLLQEAGETHHLVYRIVDGDDPDWASWYADWFIKLSELPQILGAAPVRSELVWLLVALDKEYTQAKPSTSWLEWYAERIVERLTVAAAER